MSSVRKIRLYEQEQLLFVAAFDGAWELGRQNDGEEGPFAQRSTGERCRLVIARREERSISRSHVLLEPLPDGRVRVRNVSATRPVVLLDGGEVPPGGISQFPMPLLLGVGSRVVQIEEVEQEDVLSGSLTEATRPPGQEPTQPIRFPTHIGAGEGREVVRWLHDTMGVFLSAATSTDFFDRAARAIVEAVGLEYGRVLIWCRGEWQIQSLFAAPRLAPNTVRPASRIILDRVCLEKKTCWEVPAPLSDSLKGVVAVVAAPILDREGAVVGILYGDRLQRDRPSTAAPLTELEGLLVELLASGVAAGLARLRQEQAALEARVRFEQFFTPELAHQLIDHPDLLQGRDCPVTILFCDVCRFSAISERLGPGGTVKWLADVMQTLSVCVLAQRGVLVDYIGDELMAMWGAPQADPDHPRRACRAALAMLEQLPGLNARWQAVLGEPMALALGINTGVARVGNVGSQRKFKYGPLGNEVNLASRVQGATKYLKCPLLITGSTRAHLGDELATRRLCSVRVVHIEKPVEVYELTVAGRPDWAQARQEYETALAAFEQKQFSLAARTLGNWRLQHPDDGPALVLLARAVNCMVEEPAAFDPVWVLPGK